MCTSVIPFLKSLHSVEYVRGRMVLDWRIVTSLHSQEPLRLESHHFLELVRDRSDGREAREGLVVVRALEQLQASLDAVPV